MNSYATPLLALATIFGSVITPSIASAGEDEYHVVTHCNFMERDSEGFHGELEENSSNGEFSVTSADSRRTIILCGLDPLGDETRIDKITIYGEDNESGTGSNQIFTAALQRRLLTSATVSTVGSGWNSSDSGLAHASGTINHKTDADYHYFVVIEIPGLSKNLWVWGMKVEWTVQP